MAAKRAAIVTGASSGIGLAIAKVLGEEGYALTIASRRPEKLEAAAEGLRRRRVRAAVAAPPTSPTRREIKKVVDAHRERYGRLDVLVNNAGVGVGRARRRDRRPSASTCSSTSTCARSSSSTANACRCCARPAAEHQNALVVNTSSISGKHGEGWLSVYSATKHGVVGWTEAMNKELGGDGIKSTALCPAFVDTPMTDFVKEHVPAEEMIRPEDIAESVRFLLRVSPACVVPEIMFVRPGDAL